MKYKNIIFDYGNVLGRFDPKFILRQFCDTEEDFPVLYEALYENWQALDEGSAEYGACIEKALSCLPQYLHTPAKAFFKDWYRYCTPMQESWELVRELKEQKISVYLLSNASVYFAEHAMEVCGILECFDGIIFSGPNQRAKPESGIYRLLFERFQLKPEECFFIDDNEENIKAAKALGMDGIVFTGDVKTVKKAIEF